MTNFLVDQNFNEHIVDGLTRRDATLEFTLARDVGLAEAADPTVLEWAAAALVQLHGVFCAELVGFHRHKRYLHRRWDRIGYITGLSGQRLQASQLRFVTRCGHLKPQALIVEKNVSAMLEHPFAAAGVEIPLEHRGAVGCSRAAKALLARWN